ncbi:Alkyltransferase-like protein 1 [Emydomyces testavorans]|uniref:Alkyltransferase-like protein 1 n=1 Tax=Emydomyces testavorans TaxID=2070801 RepID=A0AAF0IJE5_9EURO|nr:Alkyltransferase-like protein 1 [Emydomyces testavorans]
MARTDEAEWWFNAVYAAVQQIPHGKVTSYGHIARLLGQLTGGVSGIGMKRNALVRGPGAAGRQAVALEAEGVAVTTDSMGEYYVDFGEYGWFPDHLAGDESSDEEGGENAQ